MLEKLWLKLRKGETKKINNKTERKDGPSRRSVLKGGAAIATVGPNPQQLAEASAPLIKQAVETAVSNATKGMVPAKLLDMIRMLGDDLYRFPIINITSSELASQAEKLLGNPEFKRDKYGVIKFTDLKEVLNFRNNFTAVDEHLSIQDFFNFDFYNYVYDSEEIEDDEEYDEDGELIPPRPKLTREELEQEKGKILSLFNLKETDLIVDLQNIVEENMNRHMLNYLKELQDLNLGKFNQKNIVYLEDLGRIVKSIVKDYDYKSRLDDESQQEFVEVMKKMSDRCAEIQAPARLKIKEEGERKKLEEEAEEKDIIEQKRKEAIEGRSKREEIYCEVILLNKVRLDFAKIGDEFSFKISEKIEGFTDKATGFWYDNKEGVFFERIVRSQFARLMQTKEFQDFVLNIISKVEENEDWEEFLKEVDPKFGDKKLGSFEERKNRCFDHLIVQIPEVILEEDDKLVNKDGTENKNFGHTVILKTKNFLLGKYLLQASQTRSPKIKLPNILPFQDGAPKYKK